MIRIVVVDDHPALRAGLDTVLQSEPGLIPVGSVAGAEELWPVLYRTRPDLVLLDYHLPGDDGLQLCRRIKNELPAPRVLMYSAYAGSELALPARLAGADGLVGKHIPALELFEAIRLVARGEHLAPDVAHEQLAEASQRLDPEDLPILGMLLDRTPHADVAHVLQLDREALDHRLDRMIARLRVEVPEIRTA